MNIGETVEETSLSISHATLSLAATWRPSMHAVPAHQRAHPTKHHNNCVHDAFVERVTAAIHVVDLDFVTQSIMSLAV